MTPTTASVLGWIRKRNTNTHAHCVQRQATAYMHAHKHTHTRSHRKCGHMRSSMHKLTLISYISVCWRADVKCTISDSKCGRSNAHEKTRFYTYVKEKVICSSTNKVQLLGMTKSTQCPLCNYDFISNIVEWEMRLCIFRKVYRVAQSSVRLENTIVWQPDDIEPADQPVWFGWFYQSRSAIRRHMKQHSNI